MTDTVVEIDDPEDPIFNKLDFVYPVESFDPVDLYFVRNISAADGD